MKKLLLLVFVFAFALVGCDKSDAPNSDEGNGEVVETVAEGYWKDSAVNTFLNTSSDGFYAARQGDTHYYVDGGYIVREDMTGVNETQKWDQNGGDISELVPVGDKVFFVQIWGSSRNEALKYIDLKKQEIVRVETEEISTIAPYSCLSLHGEWLYFVREGDYPTENVHRLNVNTLESEIVFSTEKSIEIYLSKDKIFYSYYARRDDGERVIQVWTMTLDGKDNKMILEYLADGEEGHFSPTFTTGENGVEIYTLNDKATSYSLYTEHDETTETIYLYTYDLSATNYNRLLKPYPNAVISIDGSIYRVVPVGSSYKTEFVANTGVTDINYLEAVGDAVYFNATVNTDKGSRKVYYRLINGETQQLTSEETYNSWNS